MPAPEQPPTAATSRADRIAVSRPARPADRAEIGRLREEALAEQAPLRGGGLYVEREARPIPGEHDAAARVWVGLVAGAVVGYLAGRIERLSGDRRLGLVEAIYVDPACRAVGVGEAMMAEALEWFRSEGCVGVDAVALFFVASDDAAAGDQLRACAQTLPHYQRPRWLHAVQTLPRTPTGKLLRRRLQELHRTLG